MRSLALLAAPLLVLAALTACASTRPPVDAAALAGQWQLDPSASDDVNAKLSAAITAARRRFAQRHRPLGSPSGRPQQGMSEGGHGHGGGSNEGSGGGSSSNGGEAGGDEAFDTPEDIFGNGGSIAPDFAGLRARLQEVLDAPARLTITVQPGDVEIRADQLPPEDYQPDESITRLNEYGTANLKARWSGDAFELRERYTSGARLTVRYQLDAQGHLEDLRALEDPTIGTLKLRSVYHRG